MKSKDAFYFMWIDDAFGFTFYSTILLILSYIKIRLLFAVVYQVVLAYSTSTCLLKCG